MRRPDPRAAVEAFNASHVVGVSVRFWAGVRDGEGRESVTRSDAFVLGGHTACVFVEDHSGAVALSHVEVMPS